MIDFVSPQTGKKLIRENEFLVSESGEKYPIVKGIPRFVSEDNYASAFGLQWKTFSKTQLDSYSKTTITLDRFERCLGFPISELKGKNVLEVGCGAGRFTELIVKGNANEHAVDLSVAVEANKENIQNQSNYSVAQANVYSLPFPAGSFDLVICLGVVQHTPSSEKTIHALWRMVKPGGMLVIDHYHWRIGYYSTITPLFRMVLKRMKPEASTRINNKLVDFFFPLHWKFRNSPVLNWLLHRVSPLREYIKRFPEQNRDFHFEWSRLDTYDQLTDYYKHLKTPGQIRTILTKLPNVSDIWVARGGNGVEARCKKNT